MKKVAWCVSKWRILQPLSYQPPATQLYTLRGSGLEKSRILALDSWGAHQRNHFSEARLLHLPIPRKVLNSLTWDTWISLLVICWHVRLLTWPLWQKLPYILPLPLPLQSGPSKPSERLSSGLKSESPPNKTQFSTFRLCSFQSTYFTKQRCPSLTSYSPLQSVTSQPLGMQRELREEARGGPHSDEVRTIRMPYWHESQKSSTGEAVWGLPAVRWFPLSYLTLYLPVIQ